MEGEWTSCSQLQLPLVPQAPIFGQTFRRLQLSPISSQACDPCWSCLHTPESCGFLRSSHVCSGIQEIQTTSPMCPAPPCPRCRLSTLVVRGVGSSVCIVWVFNREYLWYPAPRSLQVIAACGHHLQHYGSHWVSEGDNMNTLCLGHFLCKGLAGGRFNPSQPMHRPGSEPRSPQAIRLNSTNYTSS